MRRKIKNAALFLLCITLLGGCSGKKIYFTTGLNDNEIFKIANSSYSVSEAMLLLTTEINLYEESFGTEIWDTDLDGTTLKDIVKDKVKNQLAQLKCMNLFAKDKKIELSEEEKDQVKSAAEEYFITLNPSEIKHMGITVDDIENMYEQYAVARKVYIELTKNVDIEISDLDAKMIKVQAIYVKTFTILNDERIEFSKKEKKEAKNRANQLLKAIKEGEDFNKLAETSSDNSVVEYEFGRGEMIEGFEEAAFALESGKISKVIETENGYYIIKCINDYLKDKTESNKQKLLDKEKDSVFMSEYNPFIAGLSSEFNTKAWNAIKFESDPKVITTGFYNVFDEKYLGKS